MATIIEITETSEEKTFRVCLADQCPAEPGEDHAGRYHRAWTWGLDTPMTEEDMIREVGLLAAAEAARLAPPAPASRSVSITI